VAAGGKAGVARSAKIRCIAQPDRDRPLIAADWVSRRKNAEDPPKLPDPRQEMLVVLDAAPSPNQHKPGMIATPAGRKDSPLDTDHFVYSGVRRIVHNSVEARSEDFISGSIDFSLLDGWSVHGNPSQGESHKVWGNGKYGLGWEQWLEGGGNGPNVVGTERSPSLTWGVSAIASCRQLPRNPSTRRV